MAYRRSSSMRRRVGARRSSRFMRPYSTCGARVKGPVAPFGGQRELKYLDTSISPASFDLLLTGTRIFLINDMPTGTSNVTRVGSQVTFKSVQVRGQIVCPADTRAPYQVRMCLVWDNAVNSAGLPPINTIFTNQTAIALPAVDQSNRFTILWDVTREIAMNPFPAGAGVPTVAAFGGSSSGTTLTVNEYLKLNLTTQYAATGTGAIQNGGLYLVTMGYYSLLAVGNVPATSAFPSFFGVTRCRFTDV